MKYLIPILLFSYSFAFAQDESPFKSIKEKRENLDKSMTVNEGNKDLYSYTRHEESAKNTVKSLILELEIIPTESREDELEKAVLKLDLMDDLAKYEYKTYLMPFNAEGGFYHWPTRMPSRFKIQTKEDSEKYIKWLQSVANFIDYNKSLLQQGIEANMMRPKVVVKNSIAMVSAIINNNIEENAFYQPYLSLPENMGPKQISLIKKEGLKAVEKTVLKAYKELHSFLETTYLKASPKIVGISNSTNGKAYYEDRIRHFTTLPISPDSVFNLGKSEVARIRSSMQKIIDEVEYDGTFAEFIQFLRTDPQFFAKTSDELLHYAAWLSKKAEGELPNLFSHLYEMPFTVKPVPAHLAPTYTGGRYSGGGGSRAGEYWVNTYNLPSRTLYTLPALTLHEAVPGHHLQMAVSSENTAMSNYRRRYYISAFGEGWGLYSEYLGEEMGMYDTPYDMFGRYTYEMWRACRLVVDVGMHYKGWTRDQAVDFLSSNSALSMHEVNTEIDRYIGWPGQAVSYKVGEITIMALRKMAEQELGEKFDVKEFHYRILKNGSIPLEELKREIEGYIEEVK